MCEYCLGPVKAGGALISADWASLFPRSCDLGSDPNTRTVFELKDGKWTSTAVVP